MLVYSGEFKNMRNFLRQNVQEDMQNLAKCVPHICCICRIHVAYFFAYFQHMQFRVTENNNHDH